MPAFFGPANQYDLIGAGQFALLYVVGLCVLITSARYRVRIAA